MYTIEVSNRQYGRWKGGLQCADSVDNSHISKLTDFLALSVAKFTPGCYIASHAEILGINPQTTRLLQPRALAYKSVLDPGFGVLVDRCGSDCQRREFKF